MKNPLCPICQMDHYVIKSGLNRTGSHRYRCQGCKRYFTPKPKLQGYDQSTKKKALKLYRKGVSLRAIGRSLDIHHQTISNWVKKAHRFK
jgi:transposase-like protein